MQLQIRARSRSSRAVPSVALGVISILVALGTPAVVLAGGTNGPTFGAADRDAYSIPSKPMPAQAAAGAAPVVPSISAGLNAMCSVTADHIAWCWGDNESNELGNLNTISQHRPVRAVKNGGGSLGTVRLVSAGSATDGCAQLVNQTVWCWGERWNMPRDTLGARPYKGPHQMAQLSIGDMHRCWITPDRAAWCWGNNDYGQIGDGTFISHPDDPVKVIGSGVLAIRADENSTCALRSNKTVWCWGSNEYGELGDGTTSTSPSAVQVLKASGGALRDVKWLGDGMGNHRCAVTTDGTVWCWGANGVGQLGDGTRAASSKAVHVRASRNGGPLTGVAQVVTGFGVSCALMVDQKVRCWGWDESGQVGDGTVSLMRPFPSQVRQDNGKPLKHIATVSAGAAHVCALTTLGSVWCWGSNFFGQSGDGSTSKMHAEAVQVRFPG